MDKIIFKSEYFNPIDTLSCGQIFRYKEYKDGYLVISNDKICYLYRDKGNTVIETEHKKYFHNFFDLDTDYEKICNLSLVMENKTLKKSVDLGKGIRILRQNSFETLFSFIISQNNNVKRISLTIEKLCEKVGKKINSPFGEYYAFPTALELKTLTEADYKELGFGYRGKYFISLISDIENGFEVDGLKNLSDIDLYQSLISLTGVGDKVANCVMLFGFYRTKTFPVDTWIEKIYLQDYNGNLKERKKITKWFIEKYGENAGYYQQYLFYYKRSLEKLNTLKG